MNIEMSDLFGYIIEMHEKRDQILDILPDEYGDACILISCVIDEYFIRHNMSIIEGWQMLYEIAAMVHSDMGDK